jgi:hypothetical protein
MKNMAVMQKAKPEANYPVNLTQPFYNLRQAWILKGCVCAWNTFEQNKYIQPKGGHFDGTVGGRGIFTNETIIEWLPLTDQEMETYNRKYKTGATSRNKIKTCRRLEAG